MGATDNERWRWDIEDGMSGADAKTIVCVILKDNGKGYATSETAGFHTDPDTRALAMSHVSELFDIAWDIKNKNMKFEEADIKYFGKQIL